MAKKKQFVTAAAAFAVAASAVAPAITADAASTTVRLSSDYVRGGDLNAALDKEYKGSEIHWYKSSVDMNKLGVFQTAKGFVKGQGIRVEKRVRVLNYAQEIKPESEFVFEQGVPVSGIRIQPVLFADGVVYNKPLSVAGFSTEKVGEFEGTLTYANKAYGTVTKTVKYKVVNSAPEIEEFKATSADALTVNFNKEIDFSKAKFEIKRGSVVVNATVVPSEDKKSAKLELASKLFEGDYTVTVSGLTEDALSKTSAVMNEKVNSIELSSTTAPTNAGKTEAKVGYKVMNQYGEDITSSPLASGIEWTASNGVTAKDDNKGVLSLTADEIKKGDMIAVTGINASTNTVISKVITIADVAVSDSLSFGSVYHKDGKPFSGVTPVGEFALLVNGMDQYGKALTAEEINAGFIFTSSNPAVLTIDEVVAGLGADKDKLGLKFTDGGSYSKGGTVIITAISKATGKVAQYEVKVAAAPALAAFNIAAPAEMIAANETVEIPFTAVDQFGNALTKFDELNNKVTFSSNKLKLVKGKEGVAILEYTAGAKGFDVQVATVPATGKVSQLNIDVKEAAYAATIESLKDVNTTVAVGGQTTLDYSNFVVKDQYGRAFDLKGKLGSGQDDLKVVVTETEGEGAVAVTDANLTEDASKFVVSGSEKGTEILTFSLMKDNKSVSTSPLKVTFTAVDKSAYASFEIAEIGTLYADGSTAETHTQDFKVYGVKADGSKVLLPASYYTVIKDDSVLDFTTDGKLNSVLDAETSTEFGDKNEITSKITVVVDGEKSPVTLMKEVTISKVAPKAEKIEFKKDTVVDGVAKFKASDLADTDDATALKDILKVTDQYGVGISAITPVITVTNLDDNTAENGALAVDKNGTATVDIQNALASDMFIVTYLLNGKTVTVKGLVEGTL
ncbi:MULTISPECIES: hypothetical protein [unclassified Exiguobacterium]|uniref:hypothetical protein n=1 Tax=unclassified Exiguobacterium TaxID=2644629 RepID=UPI001BE9367F|nr:MULTISPECIES: hypothetical protein [unclassified Exiguobacterium]